MTALRRGRGFKPNGKPRPAKISDFNRMKVPGVGTPDVFSLQYVLPPVMDQGGTSACVGHALASAIYGSLKYSKTPLPWVPSPDGIYRIARVLDFGSEQPIWDVGCDPANGIVGISQWGVHPMGPRPFDGRLSDADTNEMKLNKLPTLLELETDAKTLVLGAYEIMSTGLEREHDIQVALSNGYVCVDACYINPFENWKAGDPPCGDPGSSPPDHYTVTFAYDRLGGNGTVYRKRNSWGPQFGLNGDFEVSSAFVQRMTAIYALRVTL